MLRDPIPVFAVERAGGLVRTHSQIRRCVAFVGIESHGRFTPMGTGFFGGMRFDGLWFSFLVTANHVLEQIAGDSFSVRINHRSGPAESIKFKKSKGLRHSNPANDIAMFSCTIGHDIFYITVINLDKTVVQMARLNIWDINYGDEVCAIGLYNSHHGLERNIPVVRMGNLAGLLEEEVRGPSGDYVEAHLIELRTIAGLSDSPVFITPPSVAVRDGELVHMKGEFAPLPLGMLVGYHVVESKEDQIPVPRFGGGQADGASGEYSVDERNTGFGVVIPIERVFEILEREDVRKAIELATTRHRQATPFRAAIQRPLDSSLPNDPRQE